MSLGETVFGCSSGCVVLMASFRLRRGSEASSIGESSIDGGGYFGVAVSGPDMYWSKSGNVWLRGRCELFAVEAGRIGLAVNGGANGPGATPESGVKKGDVSDDGLNGPRGEKEDGAVSVYELCNELVLSE